MKLKTNLALSIKLNKEHKYKASESQKYQFIFYIKSLFRIFCHL
jgi:hypothetical protein